MHCPLTEETRMLIGKKEVGMMRQDAAIINTARAGLIEQNALIEAIKRQKIWGAGIDVYLYEPSIDDSFVNSGLQNLVLTPHIGPYTIETIGEMDHLAIKNALDTITQ
jgi:lactate dehydrogenase-like 2-hydroxyacid dehydrogenase